VSHWVVVIVERTFDNLEFACNPSKFVTMYFQSRHENDIYLDLTFVFVFAVTDTVGRDLVSSAASLYVTEYMYPLDDATEII
jgi:hypothetical protein